MNISSITKNTIRGLSQNSQPIHNLTTDTDLKGNISGGNVSGTVREGIFPESSVSVGDLLLGQNNATYLVSEAFFNYGTTKVTLRRLDIIAKVFRASGLDSFGRSEDSPMVSMVQMHRERANTFILSDRFGVCQGDKLVFSDNSTCIVSGVQTPVKGIVRVLTSKPEHIAS